MRTITITIGDGGGPFEVIEGNLTTGELTWDEMLGQVAELTHRQVALIHYPMRSKENWKQQREWQKRPHNFHPRGDDWSICSRCHLSDTYARHFVVTVFGQ